MYYYNVQDNDTGNDGNSTTQVAGRDNDITSPLSHSLDSMLQQNQGWSQLDDPLASYLDFGSMHNYSFDTALVSDAYDVSSGLQELDKTFSNVSDQAGILPVKQESEQRHSLPGSETTKVGQQSADPLPTMADQEQAILLSDPTFVLQQQLLQEHEKRKEIRKQELDREKKSEESDISASIRSAMLEPTTGVNPSQANEQASTSLDSLSEYRLKHPPDRQISKSLDSLSGNHLAQPPSRAQPVTSHKAPSAGKVQSKKETNRRSHSGVSGSSRLSRANPIPISGKGASSSKTTSSSVPTEIDHQRRFNELQARFRVNYTRKPNPRTQKQQASVSTTSVMSTSYSSVSSNNGFAQSFADTLFGPSSLPTSSAGATSNIERRHSTSLTVERNSASSGAIRIGRVAGRTNATSSGKSVATPRNAPAAQATSFPSRTMPIQIQRVQRPNASTPFDAEQRQRKLDDQLEKVDFDDITVSELKEMLRQRGRPATGKKAVLLQRLQEERDLVKAIRSGQVQRNFSQPVSLDSGRPKSFHGSFHIPIPEQQQQQQQQHPPLSPSSVPTNSSGFPQPPGSPSSVTFSLNRSIANMHIGSPPMSSQQIRRFAPYGTSGSPRMSPKMPQGYYSSSMPTSFYPSSPINNNDGAAPVNRAGRAYDAHGYPLSNYGRNSYAPFASSALATPDHEDDRNPFDQYMVDPKGRSSTEANEQSIPVPVDMEGLEWEPSIEQLLQQGMHVCLLSLRCPC